MRRPLSIPLNDFAWGNGRFVAVGMERDHTPATEAGTLGIWRRCAALRKRAGPHALSKRPAGGVVADARSLRAPVDWRAC